MSEKDRDQSNRGRLDKALKDFLRKKISPDEYEHIRNQTYEEFMEARKEAVRQPEIVY